MTFLLLRLYTFVTVFVGSTTRIYPFKITNQDKVVEKNGSVVTCGTSVAGTVSSVAVCSDEQNNRLRQRLRQQVVVDDEA